MSADIGVILLLVMLGLEYTADELRSSLRSQAPIGLLDGLLNAVPGAAVALLAGWGALAAVTLAGVTWVSSSGVIAKMLGDLGRLGNRETPAILGVLVIEDLMMALYLPVLTALLAARWRVHGGHRGRHRGRDGQHRHRRGDAVRPARHAAGLGARTRNRCCSAYWA